MLVSYGLGPSWPEQPLLTAATAQAKSGDYDGAIATLRAAFESARTRGAQLTPADLLRVPMYLQRAGKPNEAWSELCHLLDHGHPAISSDPCLVPMNRFEVYDKMRVFCLRDGLPSLSVCYGVMSHLLWLEGLRRQGCGRELREGSTTKSWTSIMVRHLKKAKSDVPVDSLLALVSSLQAEVQAGGESRCLAALCRVMRCEPRVTAEKTL